MKFVWMPPLAIACTLLMIGMLWYLISWDDIPEYLQSKIKEYIWIPIVIMIPFLIWASIGQTDEESKKYWEKIHRQQEEDKIIYKKYDDMEDLK